MYNITKNKKQKIIAWGLVVLAGLFVFGYTQLGWFNLPAGMQALPEYLMSVTAQDGVVIGAEEADGCFALTLKEADNVIWFTDRPQRDAGSIAINTLVDQWIEEFGDNPPNADLQLFSDMGGDVNMVLVLESTPRWSAYSHDLVFDKACPIFSRGTSGDLTIENISGKTFPKAVIFIDDFISGGIYSLGQLIGHAISHETKHSTTALAKAINFGNWEEHASGYASGVVAMAAEVGGDAGKKEGGTEGERVGSRVGAELGVVVVKTAASLALGAKVDGKSLIDPHDFAEALKEALTEAGGNLNLAHALAINIIDGQKDTLRVSFSDSLNEISAESGQDTFCGEPITQDNVLFDVFMYYLQLKLETRIYYDLKSGMTLPEVQSDVILNLNYDIQYSLGRALFELQYYCAFDEDDLYTTLFVQMYVINYAAGSNGKYPDIGGAVVNGVIIPVEPVSGTYQRVPIQGPSGVEYYIPAQDIVYSPEFEARVRDLMREAERRYEAETGITAPPEIRLSVADVFARDMEARSAQLDAAAGESPVIGSTIGAIDPFITPLFDATNESLSGIGRTPQPFALNPQIAQNISFSDELIATDFLQLPPPTEMMASISTSETHVTVSTSADGSVSTSRGVVNYLDYLGVRNYNKVNVSDLTSKVELKMSNPVNMQFELAIVSDRAPLEAGNIANPYNLEYVSDSSADTVVSENLIAEIVEEAVADAVVETTVEESAI